MITAALFAGSLLLIVAAAELFTNAVEWTGFRLRLASGATGSLLAALGTALPETTVPIVALLRGGDTANDVALGAILGAPFLLLTAGGGITGLAVMLRRNAPFLQVDSGQVRRDLGTFLACFALLGLCLVLPDTPRHGMAFVLLGAYAAYVVATLRGGAPNEEMPEPLHLLRWRVGTGPEPLAGVLAQLLLSVAMLIGGAELVVMAIDRVASSVRIPALLLSLVIIPLATELPETTNSVLWVRARDDGLAFGNVVGATVFQAALLGALGVSFTTWRPPSSALISSAITAACAVYLLVLLRHGRARGAQVALVGLAWVGYAVGVGVSALS